MVIEVEETVKRCCDVMLLSHSIDQPLSVAVALCTSRRPTALRLESNLNANDALLRIDFSALTTSESFSNSAPLDGF